MDESQKENFNHLKIHSQYSICEGAIKIDELADYCKVNKIKSITKLNKTNKNTFISESHINISNIFTEKKLTKIRGQKFDRTKVRLFRRFELFSARTFFLDPLVFRRGTDHIQHF